MTMGGIDERYRMRGYFWHISMRMFDSKCNFDNIIGEF